MSWVHGAVTVGRSAIVHAAYGDRGEIHSTLCGAGNTGLHVLRTSSGRIDCKRCARHLEIKIKWAEIRAYEEASRMR